MSVLAVFCLLAGFGCDRAVQWERAYGGPDFVEPVAIVRAPDSGYVLLASISDRWTGATGVWLLRLDDEGETLWTRSLIIGTETRADDIVAASDGWILVSGRADLPDSGSTPFLAQITSWGNVLHPHTFRNLRGGGPWPMVEAPDSTVVMAGSSDWKTAFVQRTSYTGYAFWDTTYSVAYEHAWFRDLASLDGSGYFICGDDFGIGLSAAGESLWSRDYSSLGTVDFHAVAAANDSGLFLGGSVYTDNGARTICTRVSRTGEVVWSRRVDDPPSGGLSLCTSRDGGCYVGGGTDETDSDDGILIKLDAGGNIEWQREFNGPEYGEIASVTETPEGEVMLLYGANEELHVLKLDP